MKLRLVVALLLASTSVAMARDHMELVCTAVVDIKDGGDKVPLFIHLFESRAAGGMHRDELLSTIYQGQLFQGQHLNKSAGPEKRVPIVLSAGKRVRFRGTYTWIGMRLTLEGKVFDDPDTKDARNVTAKLTCTDLSI